MTVAECREVVGTYYRIRDETMLGPKTKRKISRPRQMAMTLAREITGHSLPAVGRMFGGRDHTTVIHALRAVRAREANSEAVRIDMENFRLTLLTWKYQKDAETV